VNRTIKLRLLARPTVPVSTAITDICYEQKQLKNLKSLDLQMISATKLSDLWSMMLARNVESMISGRKPDMVRRWLAV
jgi:hypothetical protein